MTFIDLRTAVIGSLTTLSKAVKVANVNITSPFLLGTGDSGTAWSVDMIGGSIPSGSDGYKFLYDLFQNTNSATFIPVSPSSPPINANVLSIGGTSYTSVARASGNVLDGANTLMPTVADVNMYPMITATGNGLACKKILQKLYFIHNIFDYSNYDTFRGGWTDGSMDVTLTGFLSDGSLALNVKLVNEGYAIRGDEYDVINGSGSASGKKLIVNILDLEDLGGESIPLRKIAENTAYSILPLSRLFYLWIRMANYRIAMRYNDDGWRRAAYNLLAKYNTSMDITSSFMSGNKATNTTGLIDNLQKKTTTFRQTAGYVTFLSDNVIENQKMAVSLNTEIQSERKIEKKVKIFEYISLAILVTVFVAVSALTGFPGMDASSKFKVSLGILGATLMTLMVIVPVYQSKYVKEKFIGGPSRVSYGTSTEDQAFMEQIKIYLENTIILMTYLDSYDLATNMNKAMQNEYSQYRGINMELVVAGRKLDGINKYVDLTKTERNSRVYLYISLALILAVMLPVYIWAVDYPSIRTASMVTVGVLSTIAITLHAYETTSIVRTDGNKKYWGQPKAYA
jgi:hypothetical protein